MKTGGGGDLSGARNLGGLEEWLKKTSATREQEGNVSKTLLQDSRWRNFVWKPSFEISKILKVVAKNILLSDANGK